MQALTTTFHSRLDCLFLFQSCSAISSLMKRLQPIEGL